MSLHARKKLLLFFSIVLSVTPIIYADSLYSIFCGIFSVGLRGRGNTIRFTGLVIHSYLPQKKRVHLKEKKKQKRAMIKKKPLVNTLKQVIFYSLIHFIFSVMIKKKNYSGNHD
ncbi:hypothetical protein EDC96DRAFT_353654 [Choanephora cucurbitarum]|nr:hypothetical protein EDC96DRAFT_353654 [Choanephora cucurbitarum]